MLENLNETLKVDSAGYCSLRAWGLAPKTKDMTLTETITLSKKMGVKFIRVGGNYIASKNELDNSYLQFVANLFKQSEKRKQLSAQRAEERRKQLTITAAYSNVLNLSKNCSQPLR